MNLTMKDKDFNPLIGRTGVDVGKSFSGKDWKVTARAGLGYQFDLFANGETVLRDASGEKRIKGEKDGRMLMNVGLNAEIRDNLRFGLEFEKSAFGKYNVDNAINANFRYSSDNSPPRLRPFFYRREYVLPCDRLYRSCSHY